MLYFNAEFRQNNLIQKAFGNYINLLTKEELGKRAILMRRNVDCCEMNSNILVLINSDEKNISIMNLLLKREILKIYPDEFLNTIEQQSLPLHKLKLKVGPMGMMICNLNSKRGL